MSNKIYYLCISSLTIILLNALFMVSIAQTVIVTDNASYTTGAPSAMLDITTSGGDKGILIPRVTSNSTVTSPATGLMVYNTTTNSFHYYDGTAWIEILSTSNSIDYGEMYEYNSSAGTTLTLSMQNTFYGWNSALTGTCSGVTFDDSGDPDVLTISSTGIYKVSVAVSFIGGANKIIEVAVFKNSTKQNNLLLRRKLGTTGDVGSASISGLVSLTADDDISLQFTCTNSVSSTFIELEIINLVIERIE